MPSLLSRYQHDVPTHHLAVPLTLFLTSTLAYIGTPVRHSLLTSALAWLSLCTYTTFRTSGKSLLGGAPAQKPAWAAGGLLALAQICERAVDGSGVWWAHGLIPMVIFYVTQSEVLGFSAVPETPPASPEKSRMLEAPASSSKAPLIIFTCSAVVAIYAASGSNATIAIGLSYAIIEALAFLLIERARSEAQHARQNGGSVIYSANGLLSQPTQPAQSGLDSTLAVARDVSTASAVVTGVAALTLERFTFGGLIFRGVFGQIVKDGWMFWDPILSTIHALGMIIVHAVANGALLIMIQRRGTLLTSFVPLSAALYSQLIINFTLGRLWFAALCGLSAFAFLNEQEAFSTGSRQRMRLTRLLTLVAVLSFAVLTVFHLRQPYEQYRTGQYANAGNAISLIPNPEPLAPLRFESTRVHPVDQLVRDAEASWTLVVRAQSKSLEAAVTEYRRRYGIAPPPNFDKWYAFAKRKGVQLIDEYDTIYHSLLPFWALSPGTIRARTREALGFSDNQLMGLLIRDGKSKLAEGGQEWMQQAAVGMIAQFVEHLPDMDLAFNVHDEPRVVVPHDDLSRLVQKAIAERLAVASANSAPRNAFSTRPGDVNSGIRIPEAKTTRFNVYAHQPVWIPSRLSCSPQSPARAIDDLDARDNLTAYAVGELGLVYNHTAFSDVCNSPSFGTSHGFFDRPNAFNLVHDLFPIFSQSKISSFQDILYPSPWYWFGKVDYVAEKDLDWMAKISSLFWRGSTTGGFSRNGGWRRQHRQQIVSKLNALGNAMTLQDINKGSSDATAKPDYQVKEVSRQDHKHLMDVHFSHIGQCDPGDCHAQEEFFGISEGVSQQDQWKWRYLLDMDGNAFSGRFYAFLKSKSMVFKMAVFREWHEEWIKPWVHYVPLSLRGEEALETVRYFSSEEEGKKEAIRIAEASREWANKALRNEDFEVWFFRLLLEYGRLVDDNRAEIGFAGS